MLGNAIDSQNDCRLTILQVWRVSIQYILRHIKYWQKIIINRLRRLLKERISMKKLLMLSLVIILLTVSALPAVAKRAVSTDECGIPPTQVNKKYALAGWIQEINEGEKQVTVLVAVGNVLAKPCIQDKVVLSINLEEEDTILKSQGGAPILFSAFKVNDPVSSTGYIRFDDNYKVLWSALQITLGADLVNK
jgi:hypothetical protein